MIASIKALPRRQKIILWSVLTAIFIVSLAYSFYFKIPPAVDARAYDTIAWNVVSGVGYREAPDVPIALDPAIIRVGPGYEFFLAFFYFIFGHKLWIIWIAHALLMTASAFLMFLLSREIFQKRWNVLIGITAAVLIGLSPDLITIQGMLLSETFGIFLIIAACYVFFRMMRPAAMCAKTHAAMLGVLLAIAITVRTPALFLFIPIAWYLVREKKWREGLVMLAAIIIVFTPWTIRNWNTYHTFMPTHLAGGFNLVAGNHVGADGEQGPYPLYNTWAAESPRGYVASSERASAEFKTFILEHPLEYTKLSLIRANIYFSLARPTGFWFHLSGADKAITLALSALYAWILFTLGLLGIAKIRSLDVDAKKRALYTLAMLVLMPLALIGIIVETRYRFLVYPFFALFAGFGLSAIREKQQVWKPLAIITLLLLANTAIDVWINFERIVGKINGL